jgi:hypothetical protein
LTGHSVLILELSVELVLNGLSGGDCGSTLLLPGSRILRHFASVNSAFDPTGEDVPLRRWLQEHCPVDACWSPHGAREQARPPLYGVRDKNTGRR